MTSENIEINQNSPMSFGGTQIGMQKIHVGLSPEDAAKMAFSIFRDYYPQLKQELLSDLENMVKEMLKKIPTENIVPPTPRIAIPTLQNASITEETNIREIYARLLVSSMDKTTKDGVHPSYVEITKQLCSDEIKVLNKIFQKVFVQVITIRQVNKNGKGGYFDVLRNFSDIGEIAECENPLFINIYLDNLIRLGLVDSPKPSISDSPLKKHPFVMYIVDDSQKKMGPDYQIDYWSGLVTLTDFGRIFVQKCIA